MGYHRAAFSRLLGGSATKAFWIKTWLVEKGRNEMAVKSLKTNDTTKSLIQP
jgi:hypothetical protein